MRIHPLHSIPAMTYYMEGAGEYFPVERGTGRTTAAALRLLAHAIEHPYQWHNIRDHFGTRHANEEMRRRMQDMVSCLGLQYMHFKQDAVHFGSLR